MDIVVSGIGLVTPLGATRELTWSGVVAAKSGIKRSPNGLEARVPDASPNGARSRMGDFAVLAAREALAHGDLNGEEVGAIGCAISQSKPLLSGHDSVGGLDAALMLAAFTGWTADDVVRRELNLTGPVANVTAACASGVAAIETAARWLEDGICELALAGASESSLHPLYRAGFDRLGVLASGDETDAARPFDARRTGFVMGEGAGVFLLETSASAKRRGHRPLASVAGVRLRQSAADALRFDTDGRSIAHLINDVTAGARPGYINAHGTGTVFNDAVETRAIRAAFGAAAEKIPVSSTKAATGHLLGAAGAVEAALCVLALRDQIVPPTLNWSERDAACDLDYIPGAARHGAFFSALSLSYGFGGQLGGVLFTAK